MTEGIQRCEWGEKPVKVFEAKPGTPYHFEFHDTGHAHVVMLAPTRTAMSSGLLELVRQSLPADRRGDVQKLQLRKSKGWRRHIRRAKAQG